MSETPTGLSVHDICEPVWPGGKALGWYADDAGSISHFASPFSSEVVVLIDDRLYNGSCGLCTPSSDFAPHKYCNIKPALVTLHPNAGIILVVTVWLVVQFPIPLPPGTSVAAGPCLSRDNSVLNKSKEQTSVHDWNTKHKLTSGSDGTWTRCLKYCRFLHL